MKGGTDVTQAHAKVEATRGQVAGVSLTTSTTAVVVWSVNRYVFAGDIPAEVQMWLQLAVPAAIGYASGVVQLWRSRSRAEAAENATLAGLLPPEAPRPRR